MCRGKVEKENRSYSCTAVGYDTLQVQDQVDLEDVDYDEVNLTYT